MTTTSSRKNLTGLKFYMLKVLGLNHLSDNKKCAFWKCECDCGNICIVNGIHFKQKDGIRSCGCLKKSLMQGDEIICRVCNKKKNKNEFYNKSKGTETKHNICKECHCHALLKQKQERTYKHKILIIKHYSDGLMKCECCGESNEEFLNIDHKNNDGAKHRKSLKFKGSDVIYRWIIKNDFPPMFRILCSNCNSSYGRLGYCPHKCSDKHPQGKLNISSSKKRQILNHERKNIVLNHYSDNLMKCECCGELNEEFLTIDHINGGGSKHRKDCNLRGNGMFYKWLIDNNFPPGFRVLCFNCNSSLGRLNYCPHKCHESERHPQGKTRYQ